MSDRSKRQPLARHGRLRSPGPIRQLMKLLGVACCVVLVATLGVAAYAAYDFDSTFSADEVVLDGQEQAAPDIGELDNVGVNILLVGLDACEDAYKDLFPGRCDQAEDYGDTARYEALNDVNMMVHISAEPRRVTVVSFPRDLMIPIPECEDYEGNVTPASDYAQLNEANSRGQLNCVVNTIEQLSGQTIDYAATITWGGVIEITNAIGGVDVCVGGDGIYDDNTGLAMAPGEYNLAGQDALEFLRTRYGVGDGSDLGRISNQQVYMSALVRKLTSSEVLTNPATLLSLARTTLENVDPSSSLTDPVILARIAAAVASVSQSDYTFVQYPVAISGERVVPIESDADALWEAIEANEPFVAAGDAGVAGSEDSDETASPTPTESSSATPDPTESSGSVEIDVSGQTADEVTCSSGQGQ
ncbi:MAG: LCP family protein [Microbacterium sp.]